MVVYTWIDTGYLDAPGGKRCYSRRISSGPRMALVPLKDINRVAGVIEHLCSSHIDRPAILKRVRALEYLE